MSRQEIKSRAKSSLGKGIFSTGWLMAVLAVLIYSAISGVLSFTFIGVLIVAGAFSYGLSYVFLKNSRDGQPIEIGDVFSGFTHDFVGNFVLGLMVSIFTALWTLLFIIPGIVKSYSYSMSFYIKVDHPEKGWKECIDESRKMMNGHKMDLFIQDLSFIGWMIVGSLCLGIGTLWVTAYMQAARAQFYESIKPVEETVGSSAEDPAKSATV